METRGVEYVVFKGTANLPECSLGIAGDATGRAFNSSLLSERSRGTTILATLLLHLLSRWRSHALIGGPRLLHAVAVVFLRKLSLLLGGIILESHYD